MDEQKLPREALSDAERMILSDAITTIIEVQKENIILRRLSIALSFAIVLLTVITLW